MRNSRVKRNERKLNIQLMAFLFPVVLAAMVAFGGLSFAYFSAVSSSNGKISTDVNAQTVIEVSDITQFYTYIKSSAYNDDHPVSVESSSLVSTDSLAGATDYPRAILKLTDDIRFEDNYVVTSDVHFDLNGHTIDLNGHTLIIDHGYYGTVLLGNGRIVSTAVDEEGDSVKGSLIIDTPHASYITDDLTVAETVESKIIQMDPDNTAYDVFYMVANVMVNDVDARLPRLTFSEVNQLTVKGGITASDVLNLRKACDFGGGSDECCVFINRDIDLPYYYFSEDVQISYESDNPAVLDNYGNLVGMPETCTTVNLTVNVSGTQNSSTWNRSMVIPVHVVNTNHGETALRLGAALFKTRIQNYKSETGRAIYLKNREIHPADSYYYFTSGIDLPVVSNDFDIEYSYITYPYNHVTEGNNKPIDTGSMMAPEGRVYRFEPSEKCYFLDVSITSAGRTGSEEYRIYSTYVANDEAVARLILNELYGGTVTFDSNNGSMHLYSYDEFKDSDAFDGTATIRDYVQAYGVTGVTYSLSDIAASDYKITGSEGSGYEMSLNNGVVNPDSYKEGYLSCEFTYANGKRTTVDLYIIYITGNSNTASKYWVYYNTYSQELSSQITDSITLPFAYGAAGTFNEPYTVYDFAYNYRSESKDISGVETSVYCDSVYDLSVLTRSLPAGLKLSLADLDSAGNVTKTYISSIDYSGFTGTGKNGQPVSGTLSAETITEVFDNYLAAADYTYRDLSTARWILSINPAGIGFDDMEVLILYNYRFAADSEWSEYKASETIGDETSSVTTTYYTKLTSSLVTMEGGMVYGSGSNGIPDANLFVWMYNHLNPYNEVITTGSDLSSYFIRNDWLGTNVAMIASDTSKGNLGAVTDWTGIEYLDTVTDVDLSGITVNADLMSHLTGMASVENLSLINCGLTTALASQIADMDSVKVLNIQNNRIDLFDWAGGCSGLTVINLYGNGTGTNANYYGSEGMCNYQAYEDLNRMGVSVYYKLNNNGVPLLAEESTERSDYRRMKDIAYQASLKEGQSIDSLYASFSIRAADYGISNATLTWSAPSDDYFQVVVNYGNGITMTVKYYVDRY